MMARWLRRKFKGLTKYFWDGEAPTATQENLKSICEAIYGSLLKTNPNPTYAVKVWKATMAAELTEAFLCIVRLHRRG